MYNSGQSCCAVERVYVHRSVYDDFVKGCVSVAQSYKLGDPLADSSVNMGPIAQPRHPQFITQQIDQAVKLGAQLATGGKKTTDAKGNGRFFQPTILANCNHNMSVMVDETFGPVLAIAPVDSDEDAVKQMNDSPYGLTASVWTENAERAEKLVTQLNAGKNVTMTQQQQQQQQQHRVNFLHSTSFMITALVLLAQHEQQHSQHCNSNIRSTATATATAAANHRR